MDEPGDCPRPCSSGNRFSAARMWCGLTTVAGAGTATFATTRAFSGFFGRTAAS